jgi:hypothetical protein
MATGSASYEIPIAVPPASAGFEPKLALSYDSGGGLTEVGLGWRISGVPKLRRRTQDGLPNFDDSDRFDELLAVFARHSLDLLTVHGRTVKEMYRSEVHYDFIARAVSELSCPVLANGNVYSAEKASEVLKITDARGLMIGRGAIRNPWLFHQIRQHERGEPLFIPRGMDVLEYVRALYEAVCSPDVREAAQVQKMKKYMNYLGVGAEPTGQFLHQIRRVSTRADFFRVCEEFLNHDQATPLEPFPLALKETDVMAGEQL